MSALKIPLIIADGLWMSLSATPPNGSLPKEEHIIPDWKEHFLKSLARPCTMLRLAYWAAGGIEIIVIFASLYPEHRATVFITYNLVADQRRTAMVGRITNGFLIGNAMTFLGTLIRLQSYRTLGKYFTFELALFRDHTLVVDGPYSIVRHPSYTGLILSIIGAFINIFVAGGGWVKESGLVSENKFGLPLAMAWTSVAAAVIISLLLRIPGEEQLLRQKFGEEWERWARKVRYRLLPGIY